MTTRSLPELWIDWCSVVDAPTDHVDEAALRLFAQQAHPSKTVLTKLQRMVRSEDAVSTAWPARHLADRSSLNRLIARADVLIQNPETDWTLRLRLRRMLFAAVLIAPASHGGLGLTRAETRRLRPAGLQKLRPGVGIAEKPGSCPACAVWSWLGVIGTNNGWSHASVRSLGHQRDQKTDHHRHELPDASLDWHSCVGLLPAIDRWGYVDPYRSLHPSSLSVILRAVGALLDAPAPVPNLPTKPLAPGKEFSEEEQEQIFARADELTSRITAILLEYK